MPDMEKVISALDCRANDTDIDCRKCDYYIREDKPEYCDFRRMLRDALAMLKEQETIRQCKDCKFYAGTHPEFAMCSELDICVDYDFYCKYWRTEV